MGSYVYENEEKNRYNSKIQNFDIRKNDLGIWWIATTTTAAAAAAAAATTAAAAAPAASAAADDDDSAAAAAAAVTAAAAARTRTYGDYIWILIICLTIIRAFVVAVASIAVSPSSSPFWRTCFLGNDHAN